MIEIAAKRSPIGKAMIFLIQRSRGLRSVARHSRPSRRRSVIRAGAGGGGARVLLLDLLGVDRLGQPGGGPRAVERVLDRRLRRRAITWCWETG